MHGDIATTKQSVKWQVFRPFCNLMDHSEKLNDYSRTSLHVKQMYKYIHIFFAFSFWSSTYLLKSVYEPQFKNPCHNQRPN